MSHPTMPPLFTTRVVNVRVLLPTLYLSISIDLAGPRNIVDLLVAAVQPAVARWPNSVVVTEH
jgi:hypothetical protein